MYRDAKTHPAGTGKERAVGFGTMRHGEILPADPEAGRLFNYPAFSSLGRRPGSAAGNALGALLRVR
jgi:hypothetical protein